MVILPTMMQSDTLLLSSFVTCVEKKSSISPNYHSGKENACATLLPTPSDSNLRFLCFFSRTWVGIFIIVWNISMYRASTQEQHTSNAIRNFILNSIKERELDYFVLYNSFIKPKDLSQSFKEFVIKDIKPNMT